MLIIKEKFRTILFSSLVVLANVSYGSCGGVALNQTIQKAMDDARTMFQLPAIQVSLSCPGESTPRDFVSGYSSIIANAKPLESTHVFQIGSETKTFIAAIILQLESEGKLSIYDPIGSYLTGLPTAWQSITIQQILNHTSGIPDYTKTTELQNGLINSNYNKQWTTDELIQLVFNRSLLFQPSLGWDYSNTNYILAGKIIEAVTKNPLVDEINNRLLKPLNLSHTYYVSEAYSDDMLQRMAHGYSAVGLFPNEPKDITFINPSWINAAGAMLSTTHDKAIWLRELLTTNHVLPEIQKTELKHLMDLESGQPLPVKSNKPGYGAGIMGLFTSATGQLWGNAGKTLGYISSTILLECNDIVFSTNLNRVNKTDIEGVGSRMLVMQMLFLIQKFDTEHHCQTKAQLPLNISFMELN